MSSEPGEEAIASFINMLSTPRDKAISFLKANGCDLQKAVNAYFEDPIGPQTESLDNTSNLKPPALFYDRDASRIAATAPPSRPPSRVSTSGPESNESRWDITPLHQTDNWTQNDWHPKENNSWSNTERENREIQEAMEISLSEGMSHQEIGVVDAAAAGVSSEPHFGKATRENYENSDWAMTVFNETSQEVIVNPEPEDRKKIGNQPVFLRPTRDGLHLGGLLTILHEIPLAREALLFRNKLLYDYGGDPQWWNGQIINVPKIVSIHEGHDATDWEDVIHESQRLIAFLDGTQRAFGSSDMLAHIKQDTDSYYSSDSEEAVSRFLEAWHLAAEKADPNSPFLTVFKSLASKKSPFADGFEPESKEIWTFEPAVEQEHGQTLYDVFDKSMWADVPNSPELDDVWFENVSDVLVIKLDAPQNAKSVDVKIPAVFYPDRYLGRQRESSRAMRAKRLLVQERLLDIQQQIERWTKLPEGHAEKKPNMTRVELLEKMAISIPIVLAETIARNADLVRRFPEIPIMSVEAAQEKMERVPRQLRAEAAKLERKLKELGNKKQETMEALRGFSKFLTESDPTESPVCKYMLRGVCTEPHVMYVLKRSDVSDSDVVIDSSDQAPSYQWWRISFSTEDGKTQQAEKRQASHNAAQQNGDVMGYTARKVREIEVLRAAREEGVSVTIVYATEDAMKAPVNPLPQQLVGFVARDNQFFTAECNESRMETDQIQESDAQEQPSTDPSNMFETEWTKSDIPEKESGDQVNVFDYEVYRSDEDDPIQEMTEKDGPSLLAGTVMQLSEKTDDQA